MGAEDGTEVWIPEDVDVRAIRQRLGMTQEAFAESFGFSVSATREWEWKRRRPNAAARLLMLVIDHNPGAVRAALDAAASRD